MSLQLFELVPATPSREAAEALIADVPPPRDTVTLTAMATARLGKKVLDLEDVTVRYPVSTGRADEADRVGAPAERAGPLGTRPGPIW